jgi:hypothetical protein
MGHTCSEATTDWGSNALPLRQTTFGVSDTPDFQDTPGIEPRLSKKNVVCSKKSMSKIKRRRAPGVGFEPTRSAWDRFQSNALTTRLRVGILMGIKTGQNQVGRATSNQKSSYRGIN